MCSSDLDFVLLNASAALVVAGLAESVREGVELAATTIDSGAAIETLDRYVRLTKSFDDDTNDGD